MKKRLKLLAEYPNIQNEAEIQKCKENNFAKIDKNISDLGGVYFLYDKDFELII